ncbi:GNAT family N-acetyltransferase [Acinetobacter dispersus]|uniref:GNAT family N-acetyltransferase n=1 Tax=Acinetobacter dispersus TaxID=70348 RepID=UPI0021CD714A|nr:GNAT family N-acetyltransferase [Acinetobacter dispersus]MCU4337390.1 GNAT family N-acetyltransferase [Acinetobacter dispersus]
MDEIRITLNKNEMDINVVHQFLRNTYWSKGIPKTVVQSAIENSLCVGLMRNDQIIGFGRAITDYATFAYLADIYVEAPFRGKGYSELIVNALLDQCDSKGLRRILLATADAHGLYRKFGFANLAKPENFMEINQPNIYQK